MANEPFRIINRANPINAIGLAIGWLIPNTPEFDHKIRNALPGWSIVASSQAPLSVDPADIQSARRLTGLPLDIPILLFGWSAGCQSVRAALLSKACDPWGIACFDGTMGNVPPLPWQIKVWSDLAVRARAGLCQLVLTSTQMTYTEQIPEGHPGRGEATSHIIASALGIPATSFLPSVPPIVEGDLFAACYASDAGPTERSAQAHRDQINIVAPVLLARFSNGPGRLPAIVPIQTSPDGSSPWRDPAKSLSERLEVWAKAELDMWKNMGLSESDGPNDSPRIREYLGITFKRRITNEILKVHGAAWCAIAACFGVYSCLLEGDRGLEYRVSGIELEQDAESNHTFSHTPARGSLVILHRTGEPWARHVGIVLSCDDKTMTFAAGNDGNTWSEHTISIDDPIIIGYVKIG